MATMTARNASLSQASSQGNRVNEQNANLGQHQSQKDSLVLIAIWRLQPARAEQAAIRIRTATLIDAIVSAPAVHPIALGVKPDAIATRAAGEQDGRNRLCHGQNWTFLAQRPT
jgi:hypothetical protein